MLIGENFEKMECEWMGLHLLEQNTFFEDMLLFAVSLFFFYRIGRLARQEQFFSSWRKFYLLFAISFFFGGLGHLLYNYWGIPGKTPSWFLSILAIYFVEKAMISIHPKENLRRILDKVSIVKLIVALIAAVCVSVFVDLEADYSKGMLVPTINSTIGLVGSLGILGATYARTIKSFRILWISVLVLLPAAVIQAMKINIHPWFDKNSAGHLLLIVTLILYYQGIKGYAAFLRKN